MISRDQTNASLGIKVSAGFLSGTIAAFIGNPLEVSFSPFSSLLPLNGECSSLSKFASKQKGVSILVLFQPSKASSLMKGLVGIFALSLLISWFVSHSVSLLRLWRGIGPTIMRSAFLTASQMASYDQSKELLISYLSMTDGPLLHLCAGMVSGLVSTTATNPGTLRQEFFSNILISFFFLFFGSGCNQNTCYEFTGR